MTEVCRRGSKRRGSKARTDSCFYHQGFGPKSGLLRVWHPHQAATIAISLSFLPLSKFLLGVPFISHLPLCPRMPFSPCLCACVCVSPVSQSCALYMWMQLQEALSSPRPSDGQAFGPGVSPVSWIELQLEHLLPSGAAHQPKHRTWYVR